MQLMLQTNQGGREEAVLASRHHMTAKALALLQSVKHIAKMSTQHKLCCHQPTLDTASTTKAGLLHDTDLAVHMPPATQQKGNLVGCPSPSVAGASCQQTFLLGTAGFILVTNKQLPKPAPENSFSAISMWNFT